MTRILANPELLTLARERVRVDALTPDKLVASSMNARLLDNFTRGSRGGRLFVPARVATFL